jgi:hypothetical protein
MSSNYGRRFGSPARRAAAITVPSGRFCPYSRYRACRAWSIAEGHITDTHVQDAIEATITKVEPEEEEEIAQPTPIAQHAWKVIAPDGREEITYQPIPGFEHLWNGPSLSPITRSPNTAPMPAPHCQATTSQVPVTGN